MKRHYHPAPPDGNTRVSVYFWKTFSHPLFQKGNIPNCRLMKRSNRPNQGIDSLSFSSTTPSVEEDSESYNDATLATTTYPAAFTVQESIFYDYNFCCGVSSFFGHDDSSMNEFHVENTTNITNVEALELLRRLSE